MAEAFDVWLGRLPKWLQTAASALLARGTPPSAPEIKTLADLCHAEACGAAGAFSTIPPGAFAVAAAADPVRVTRIEAIQGVNALDPSAHLDFGNADLAVVFGANGSGKSGFARLIKHAAGSRGRTDLLPNVFVVAKDKPQATFVLDQGGKLSQALWTGTPLASLQHVHVFDSETAKQYVAQKTEARYEPRRLNFLTVLVKICDEVGAELARRKVLLPSAMPAIPASLASTQLALAILKMKANEDPAKLAAKFHLAPDHAEKLKALTEALQIPDPAKRLAELGMRRDALNATRKLLETLASGLGDEAVAKLTAARADAGDARAAANEVARLTLDQSILVGVGEPTWQAMWDAACRYSTEVAYVGQPFPKVDEGSACVLCQQPLSAVAASRLRSFQEFVRGEVEQKAKDAEARRDAVLASIPLVPSSPDWGAHFGGIEGVDLLSAKVHSAATLRRASMVDGLAAAELPGVDFGGLVAAVNAAEESVGRELELVVQAQQQDQRHKLEAELGELGMKSWYQANAVAVQDELTRLKKIASLDAAIKKTNTTAITARKNELAETELTGGFQARFAEELNRLGASIGVTPVVVTRAKGKIEFALAFTDASTQTGVEKVLSEGEARIVALAAFLADVTVADARTPFIFDDPISSLDHRFEERVAARLVELAETRQVLVFTHRISLVTILGDIRKKRAAVLASTGGGGAPEMTQISLVKMGKRIGIPYASLVKQGKVATGLEDLIKTHLPLAKGHFDAGRADEYERSIKAICSELRILTERTVEEVLLNDVLKRFRRGIVTKDKLYDLAKIRLSDCQFIDDLMTRLSVYEHSQPQEFPAEIPEYSEVKKDAEALREWVKGFSARTVPSHAGALADVPAA